LFTSTSINLHGGAVMFFSLWTLFGWFTTWNKSKTFVLAILTLYG
jgi:hypothetical protein